MGSGQDTVAYNVQLTEPGQLNSCLSVTLTSFAFCNKKKGEMDFDGTIQRCHTDT